MEQSVPSVWMITDQNTGSPSYIQMEDDEGVERLIGPFAYTSENDAREAARTRSFLPVNIGPVELEATEIEGMGFVSGILTRFNPSNTDVVVLNDGLFPLTKNGAGWVDDTTGRENWTPLFGNDPTEWMDVVLEQVSGVLGVEVIRVQQGNSDASRTYRLVQQKVSTHIEPESPALYGEIDPGVTYKVYTSGMSEFDLPDIEMLGVPALFAGQAMESLLGWAAYSIDHTLVEGMSVVGSSDPLNVILKAEQVGNRLRLVVEQVLYTSPMSSSEMVH